MAVEAALDALRSRWPDAQVRRVIRDEPERRNVLLAVTIGDDPAVLKVARRGALAVERSALRWLCGVDAPALRADGPGWALLEAVSDAAPTPAELGACLGRIHARTQGFAWEQPEIEVEHAVYRWGRALDGLPGRAALDRRALRELAWARRTLERPGDARVLSHGDVGPPNVGARAGRLVLLDWEVAGPRHLALDWLPAVQPWLRAEIVPWSAAEETLFRAAYLGAHPAAAPWLDAGIAAAAVAWAAVLLRSPGAAPARRAGLLGEASARLAEPCPALSRIFRALVEVG